VSNNEFIKVDDLFKGKPDREERIPPGAWGNMQHLLESAGTTGGGLAGGSLNRYVALALLTLGIGTTAVTWQYNQSRPVLFSETSTDQGSPASGTGNASSVTGDHNSVSQNGTASSASVAATSSDAAQVNAAASADHAAVTGNRSNRSNTSANHSNAEHNPPQSGNHSVAGIAGTASVQHSNATAQPAKGHGSRKQRNQAAAQQQQALAVNDQITQNLAGLPQQAAAGQTDFNTTAAEKAMATIDKSLYTPKQAADTQYAAIVPGSTQKFVLTQQNEWYKEQSKTVNEIHAVRHLIKDDKGQKVTSVVMDTVKNVRVTRKFLAPLNPQDKMELLAITSRNTGIFVKARAASILAPGLSSNNTVSVAESNVSVAPLSEYKVASTTAQKGSFAKHFYDVLSNYLSMEKPYYFSAAIGMNSTLSTYMPTGYHFSIGGYYELKERLTLGAELKYSHQGLLPQNILESFKSYENQTSTVVNGQTMYSATEYNKQNSYQLDNINSFELPVTLRYQLSKFSVFGGLQATYFSPVKYTSILNKDMEAAKTVLSETALVSGSGKINQQDFRSRMGLGYTAGIVYDLSKNISLDMRISHNLWTNVSKTSQLSTQLYQYPNVQFSLFYFLGKKDKVIYMMSDRK
jgi:hypothetical protein